MYKVTDMAAEYSKYNFEGSLNTGFTTAVYKIEPPLPDVGDEFLQGIVEGGRYKQRLNLLATTSEATFLVYKPHGKNKDEQMTCVLGIRGMLDKALQQLGEGNTEGLLDMMHNDHVAPIIKSITAGR